MNPAMLAGASYITETIKTAISSGFSDVTASFTDVMGVYVPAVIGIVGLTGAVGFAVKKIKGALNAAS